MEKATFGAGCFWHVEESFRPIKGVVETAVGFMGGSVPKPTYEQVCSDKTEHVEVTEVVYDPEVVTYEELLNVFWEGHDPTQVNKQGPDVGTQYRTVIFYNTEEQRLAAEKSKKALESAGKYSEPLATTIEPAGAFYKAEEYHQKYLAKRGLFTCPI